MLRKIMLQAGHQNAKNNCDPNLRGGTGAPGEVEFTVRVRDALSKILLEKKNTDGTQAFQLFLKDATANCDQTLDNVDYDLFFAIHYDADVYGKGGGFTDFPEPSTDFATAESQRLARVIAEEYFPHSGIEFIPPPARRNPNTKYYYMWKFLSKKTPCVIIEAGVGQNAHDKVILADTQRIANAMARGICKAFGVPFTTPTPQPQPPTPNWEQRYNQEVIEHGKTKQAFKEYKDGETARIEAATKPLQAKIDKAKADLA